MRNVNNMPARFGLYDPAFEHDSCGVGFVANIDGRKSHNIIVQGLEVLERLAHRGACGCDPNTGDGAGIMLQMPDEFLRHASDSLPFEMPPFGEYAVGNIFLDKDPAKREWAEKRLEQIVKEEGQTVLGWREVPVNNSVIGYVAKSTEPIIKQIYIQRGENCINADAFERKLYVIRKIAYNTIVRNPDYQGYFYVPSLSYKTLNYKGQLTAHQVIQYFPDLSDPNMVSGLAMVHSRYSTNTFPTWDLGQPFRYLAHNGEINTVQGNTNWMHARESLMKSDLFGEDIKKLFPISLHGASDSAVIDNALELLTLGGRSLEHAILMLIPEAWSGHESMSQEKKDFYEYHSCLMEPWDGPASIAFSDGIRIGALLDRNGLRPSRYTVTKDGFVVMASETGVLNIAPENVESKGRLQPGRMFLIDTEQNRIINDEEIKHSLAARKPYGEWLKQNRVCIVDLPDVPYKGSNNGDEDLPLLKKQQTFGYTDEDLKFLIQPMAIDGKEPVGSMGNDTPLAVLSDREQLLFNYFKQRFAQVTNPPIDPIREELVMSLETYVGSEGNVLDETPDQCHMLKLEQPILTNEVMEKLRTVNSGKLNTIKLDATFPVAEGDAGLQNAMERLCNEAHQAIEDGVNIIILSDKNISEKRAPVPSLLMCSGVHHHLVREGTRTRAGLVIETGEAREVMHFALLVGYGAGAVNPYVALDTVIDLCKDGELGEIQDEKTAVKNYIEAVNKGLLKVFSKMGISTLQSYRGAQIFEAIGLGKQIIDQYFTGTTSRIGGIEIDVVAQETLFRHEFAFPNYAQDNDDLMIGGYYHWRRDGEHHMVNPQMVAKLQHAVHINSYDVFKEYSTIVNDENRKHSTLRGLMDFKWADQPIPIEEVEPVIEIVKRFVTGAISFGAISKEAHENLAIAMNRLGGKSNTGEGGEDPERFIPLPNGDSKRSAIKQVASGRFGVTNEYLTNADELQIKMAQGAKPGEGGQLPGHKVDRVIAKVRHSTPGVTLISPPPHHDIYSIEDLAQLIHDLKNSNPKARISVKLVSEIGVGTVAAGVSKGHSDHVLISGDSGGTGASPLSSIKHAGLPWELGLAETQQTLVLNDLRDRIIVQTDGQLKTGRDVAVAALLGAEEMGFSTAALVASGCIMMRKCHLNTCPVGIATQKPELRKKFAGKPEDVINFFMFIAEEVREIMAKLGIRKMDDMIGHSELLIPKPDPNHWKAKYVDFSMILAKPDVNHGIRCTKQQDHGLDKALDNTELLSRCKDAIENQTPTEFSIPIGNVNRTVGTILSHEITKKHGIHGLPPETIKIHFTGSAGQSVGAFMANGIRMTIEGDANDYTGKGMTGGKIIIYPPKASTFKAEENIIIGNVALYGATGGECYFRGVAGERFCVRNSGAWAVVEGIGDHGCEYMTGGRAVIIGPTGRNFAAGMSGGIAYVLDEDGTFEINCNKGMVELDPIDAEAEEELKTMLQRHLDYTESVVAKRILDNWSDYLPKFIKVMPIDYKRYLKEIAAEEVKPAESKTLELQGATNG